MSSLPLSRLYNIIYHKNALGELATLLEPTECLPISIHAFEAEYHPEKSPYLHVEVARSKRIGDKFELLHISSIRAHNSGKGWQISRDTIDYVLDNDVSSKIEVRSFRDMVEQLVTLANIIAPSIDDARVISPESKLSFRVSHGVGSAIDTLESLGITLKTTLANRERLTYP